MAGLETVGSDVLVVFETGFAGAGAAAPSQAQPAGFEQVFEEGMQVSPHALLVAPQVLQQSFAYPSEGRSARKQTKAM